MAPLLARLNDKPFQALPGSRASTFAAVDAPALMALPLQRYEMATFQTSPRRDKAPLFLLALANFGPFK
jgi:hypothetical protein